jgi:hypothetical protein
MLFLFFGSGAQYPHLHSRKAFTFLASQLFFSQLPVTFSPLFAISFTIRFLPFYSFAFGLFTTSKS